MDTGGMEGIKRRRGMEGRRFGKLLERQRRGLHEWEVNMQIYK
jgi:hypothetical protein